MSFAGYERLRPMGMVMAPRPVFAVPSLLLGLRDSDIFAIEEAWIAEGGGETFGDFYARLQATFADDDRRRERERETLTDSEVTLWK